MMSFLDPTRADTVSPRREKGQKGQDLIEYTLMLAFVAVASAALFLSAGTSVEKIWQKCDSQMQASHARQSAPAKGVAK